MLRRFTDHPATVGESYLQHQRAAFGYSARLFRASLCCAVHGLFPWLHTRSGSDCIKALHGELQARTATADTATGPLPLPAGEQQAA
ncbi:MAG: DUF6356 family protein [Pseudomonadota bacterium]